MLHKSRSVGYMHRIWLALALAIGCSGQGPANTCQSNSPVGGNDNSACAGASNGGLASLGGAGGVGSQSSMGGAVMTGGQTGVGALGGTGTVCYRGNVDPPQVVVSFYGNNKAVTVCHHMCTADKQGKECNQGYPADMSLSPNHVAVWFVALATGDGASVSIRNVKVFGIGSANTYVALNEGMPLPIPTYVYANFASGWTQSDTNYFDPGNCSNTEFQLALPDPNSNLPFLHPSTTHVPLENSTDVVATAEVALHNAEIQIGFDYYDSVVNGCVVDPQHRTWEGSRGSWTASTGSGADTFVVVTTAALSNPECCVDPGSLPSSGVGGAGGNSGVGGATGSAGNSGTGGTPATSAWQFNVTSTVSPTGTVEVMNKRTWVRLAQGSFPLSFTVPASEFLSTDDLVIEWPMGASTMDGWLCNDTGLHGTVTATDPSGSLWNGYANWKNTNDHSQGCNVGLQ